MSGAGSMRLEANEMDCDYVERECLLFEAGEYADKGLTISEEDLVAIARNSAAEIPVRVEHLPESAFDEAMGMVRNLTARGDRLWGIIRLPVETWRFLQRAGAKALSVALDATGMRVLEASIVKRPRVESAQVFGDCSNFISNKDTNISRILLETNIEWDQEGAQQDMGIKQFAERLIGQIRELAAGADESSVSVMAPAELDRRIMEFRRSGRLSANPAAEELARAILRCENSHFIQFKQETQPLAELFQRFLEANGEVVPMGERLPANSEDRGSASERLVKLAREIAEKEGINFTVAFSRASTRRPDLAAAARTEGFGG